MKRRFSEDEINNRQQALQSLMGHHGWKVFTEIVQGFQLANQAEMFSSKFVELEPYEKDVQHRSLVQQNVILERILNLPEWLDKQRPSRWDLSNFITREKQHGREHT